MKILKFLFILFLPVIFISAGLEGVKLTGVGINNVIQLLLEATWDNAADQTFSDSQVLDTPAEGVREGSLTVVDIGTGTVKVVSNKLEIVGGTAWGDAGVNSQSITRASGKMFISTMTPHMDGLAVGWFDVQNASSAASWMNVLFFSGDNTLIPYENHLEKPVVGAYTNTEYQITVVLLATGAHYFIKGGTYTDWTLLWVGDAGNTATLYASIASRRTFQSIHDNLLVPNYDFSAVLQHTALDTGTGTNGDDLATHAMDVDPDGNDWTEQVGNLEIQSNKIVTTGGAGIADFDSLIADFVYRVQVTTPGAGTTPGGLVIRAADYTGASEDYWYIKITPGTVGNDFEIIEFAAGTETSRATANVDFATSTAYAITVIADDEDITAFVDGGDEITYASAASGKTVTRHGIQDEGTANIQFDNISVWPRTSSTYDSQFTAGTGGLY